LAGLLGVTASAGAKSFSHSISFGVTLAALTNLAQYVAWKTSVRKGRHWQKFGPLYLVCVAVPLVMADLTRHVLQDSGIWSGPSSSMYKPNCGHSERRLGGITCLSLTGWLFTIVFTYIGFACMITGIFWGADMHIKLRKAWRGLRRARHH